MATDKLKQFLQLRKELLQEKKDLEARLREINAVLDGPGATDQTTSGRTGRGRGARGENSQSLRSTILEVNTHPMTKKDLLDAVLATGYKFTTKTPMNSINVVLYGQKPKFQKRDGKFLAQKG